MAGKFRTAKGKATPYALSCGYSDTYTDYSKGLYLHLWQESPGLTGYHVRLTQRETQKGQHLIQNVFWVSFPSLTKARIVYDSTRRLIKTLELSELLEFLGK